MDLTDARANVADQDKGRELELVDPFTGKLTAMKFTVVGPDSTTARRARLRMLDEIAEARGPTGFVAAEHMESFRLAMLAALVIRWDVTEGGKPVPLNTKNVVAMLGIQWIEEQVDAFAGDRRHFAFGGVMDRIDIEVKLATDEAGAIEGKAWIFGQPDRIGDDILPGAFKAALPLPMLFGHDMGDPVGVWEEMAEAKGALVVKGRLLVDEVGRAREVSALVKAGAVRGLSIGFTTKKAVARQGGGRTIHALELHEVSLVTIGMHAGAKITSAKSAVEALNIAAAIHRATAQLAAR